MREVDEACVKQEKKKKQGAETCPTSAALIRTLSS
jgi:hypothetical protein